MTLDDVVQLARKEETGGFIEGCNYFSRRKSKMVFLGVEVFFIFQSVKLQ